MRSGELSKAAGVSPDTLRLYERKGLLPKPPRSSNGYRVYPADALARVRLVRAALSVGFTLDELAEILGERDGGGAPCARVRDLAGSKLQNLEEHLRILEGLRSRLGAVLEEWDAALGRTPASGRARLLETLARATAPIERGLAPHIVPSLTKPVQKESDDD